jgi:hypothetical protein
VTSSVKISAGVSAGTSVGVSVESLIMVYVADSIGGSAATFSESSISSESVSSYSDPAGAAGAISLSYD